MNGGRTNTQAAKSLNCIFRLHFTAEPVVIFWGGKIRESKWTLIKELYIWFVAQNTEMTDQSIGRGKFAGLLLLLQGLLLILFVVFVGYSDELLPDGENETKADSKYSGECNLHYDASKSEW